MTDETYAYHSVSNKKTQAPYIMKIRFSNNDRKHIKDVLYHTKTTDSDNLVKIVGVHEELRYTYIFTENLGYKTLLEFIIKSDYLNDDMNKLRFFFKFLEALRYLHDKDIGNVKLRIASILVNRNNEPVIQNLGRCTSLLDYKLKLYDALRKEEQNEANPNRDVYLSFTLNEVWLLGSIFYFLIHQKPIKFNFYSPDAFEHYTNKSIHVKDRLPIEFINILEMCLQSRLSRRANFDDLYNIVEKMLTKGTLRYVDTKSYLGLDEFLFEPDVEFDISNNMRLLVIAILVVFITLSMIIICAVKVILNREDEKCEDANANLDAMVSCVVL